jgi:hypothetical protein
LKGGFPDVIKLHHSCAMILTRTEVHDLLTDLRRDATRQSPVTIELRQQLAAVSRLMDTARLAGLNVHLKHQGIRS